MSFQIETAQRSQAKLRIGLAAPSGGGKTMSALKLAYGLTGSWDKVGVIDTEQGSASLYSNLGGYKVIRFDAPFTPERYIEAIHAFEKAGMEVIIIDSITHVWKGKGGLLEYTNKLGGRFQDWAKSTPLYQAWLDAILQSKAHIITTIRKKESYAMTTEGGKTKVTKQGLDDEIRDGFSYELTVAFDINMNHIAEPSKDRTSLFMKETGDVQGFVITEETGKKLKAWSESGKAPESVPTVKPVENTEVKADKKDMITDFQKKRIQTLGEDLGKTPAQSLNSVMNFYKETSIDDITRDQAASMITAMMKKIKENKEMMSNEETEELVDSIPF